MRISGTGLSSVILAKQSSLKIFDGSDEQADWRSCT